MDFSLIIAGLGIGVAMAAPLGPVNLIVIRTALCHDLKVAFFAGLGAVLADVLIAGIAAYGIQSIFHLVLDYAKFLQVVGGLLLIVLGIRTAQTHFAASDLAATPHAARFGLTFSLSVTNPGLVLQRACFERNALPAGHRCPRHCLGWRVVVAVLEFLHWEAENQAWRFDFGSH